MRLLLVDGMILSRSFETVVKARTMTSHKEVGWMAMPINLSGHVLRIMLFLWESKTSLE